MSSQAEFKACGRTGAGRRLVSAQQLPQRNGVVFAGTVPSRAKAGGGDGWAGGRQPQMIEDRLYRPGRCDVGEHYAAAAAGTGEHVLAEEAHQQVGPASRLRCEPSGAGELRPRQAAFGPAGRESPGVESLPPAVLRTSPGFWRVP